VGSKAEWIRKTRARLLERADQRPRHRYEPGETFMVMGEPHGLVIAEGLRPALEFDGTFRLTAGGGPKDRALFEAWYRRRAAEVFSERAAHWAGRMGVAPARVAVSGAGTKWGSCDARGIVRFAWRLVMAPPSVIDYLIVHELAHMKVWGHRRAFWTLVEIHLPAYRAHRRWLADHGHTLDL
jgi:hypothetical protein